MANVTCGMCGWSGDPDECQPCMSPYHAMRCAKCGSTKIDTSELNKEWAEQGKLYGYGDHNSLQMNVPEVPRMTKSVTTGMVTEVDEPD